MPFIASVVLIAVALIACFRFGLLVAGLVAVLPFLGVLFGLLALDPAIALAPVAGLVAAAQIASGRSYGQVIAVAASPNILYSFYLVVALNEKTFALSGLDAEQQRELQESGLEPLAQQIELPIEELVRLVVLLQPGFEALYTLLTLVLGYVLGRFLGQRTGVVVLPPPLPVREWRLWEPMIWVLVGGVALLLVTDESLISRVGINLVVVSLTLYAVQGFSVARFYLWRLRVVRTLQFLLFFVAFVTGWGGPILAGVGLMDTWFDWRRLGRRQSQHEEI